jgi:uncharacterized protein YjiS (DUF1127 family)
MVHVDTGAFTEATMSITPIASSAERLALELRFHLLNHRTRLKVAASRPFAPSGTWATLSASARRFAAWIARMQAQATRRRELAALDARTLADLGIDRSEIDSVLGEHVGALEATRRRIVAAA